MENGEVKWYQKTWFKILMLVIAIIMVGAFVVLGVMYSPRMDMFRDLTRKYEVVDLALTPPDLS